MLTTAARLALLGLAVAATGAVAAEAEPGATGMPQLDARTYPSQIFWLIVSFATLYYLLTKKALPRVAEILETRQERIAADLDRAARLRAEAEEAAKTFDAVLAEAHLGAQAAVKEVQDRIAAETARRQAALDSELAGKLADAERRIATAKARALARVSDVAVEVAQAATRRLTGIEVTPAEAQAVVARLAGRAG